MDDIGTVAFAAVAPGSVWNTKIYPANYFADVIRFLREKKYFVFLIGAAGEDSLCRQIEGQFISGVESVAGKLTVMESIALLKKASLLISNDSAPTHLGMIADIPIITIYCSTIPEFGFYPYNEQSRYVSLDGLKCKPCGIHGHKECPINTFECGIKLMPDTVISSVKEILKV